MATFIIGDVHGCFNELQQLLKKISFNPSKDKLWFTGDLVNKGPESYKTIRFIMDLPNANSVLGNHDLHLLSMSQDLFPKKRWANLNEILQSDDIDNIIHWLRNRPLLYKGPNFILCHAGIYPQWDKNTACKYAKEVEQILQGDTWQQLLANMYADTPEIWHNELSGWERYRCIINIFTRMRYLNDKLELNFTETGVKPSGNKLHPWFQYSNNITEAIIFGHWASLKSQYISKKYISLDGGCVWGGKLVALNANTFERFEIKSNFSTS